MVRDQRDFQEQVYRHENDIQLQNGQNFRSHPAFSPSGDCAKMFE
jgi:hypothetical protein